MESLYSESMYLTYRQRMMVCSKWTKVAQLLCDKLRIQIQFFPPSWKPLCDAVSGVWNAFEIKLYDSLTNFNDLKLLDLDENFYSKEQLSTLFCDVTKLNHYFQGYFYVDSNRLLYLFRLIYVG